MLTADRGGVHLIGDRVQVHRRQPEGGNVMRRILFCAAMMGVVAVPAGARTWTVGGVGADFPFISPAIAAAYMNGLKPDPG